MKVDWQAAHKEFSEKADRLPLEDLDLICEGLRNYQHKHPTIRPGVWVGPNRVLAMLCAQLLESYERDTWGRE